MRSFPLAIGPHIRTVSVAPRFGGKAARKHAQQDRSDGQPWWIDIENSIGTMITDYQAKYIARDLTRRRSSDSAERLAVAVAGAQVHYEISPSAR